MFIYKCNFREAKQKIIRDRYIENLSNCESRCKDILLRYNLSRDSRNSTCMIMYNNIYVHV